MTRALAFSSPLSAGEMFPFNDGLVKFYLRNEEASIAELLTQYCPDAKQQARIDLLGKALIQGVREHKGGVHIESFLTEYGLDNHEGVTLMCLAEALLRIPDPMTAEHFVKDKLEHADWSEHLGHSDTFWVNFSTWGLLLTGKILTPKTSSPHSESDGPSGADTSWLRDWLKNLIRKLGEPLVLSSLTQAMRMIGRQFVAGETIGSAIQNNVKQREKGYTHSYDMLGEAALCQQDVKRYMNAYRSGILGLAEQHNNQPEAATLSIKLSALHPRFELKQNEGLERLRENLLQLLTCAYQHDIPVTIDAEESWRLEPQLMIFAQLIRREPFRRWGKFGIAVQAYQKRAPQVIDWLIDLSNSLRCQIPLRLVKGAYWDSEIKQAQVLGLEDYPVYTLKAASDLSFLVCAQKVFQRGHFMTPQFATHNAHTVASILTMAEPYHHGRYEFQRLHGMGEALYDYLIAHHKDQKCRVYAPVGNYKEVLPYLVRRLLENGANTSFVRLLNQKNGQPGVDDQGLMANPVDQLTRLSKLSNVRIPKPPALFGLERQNSKGINLESSDTMAALTLALAPQLNKTWNLDPNNTDKKLQSSIISPADKHDQVGRFTPLNADQCLQVMRSSVMAFDQWQQHSADDRAEQLIRASKLIEQDADVLLALLMREAGKTLSGAWGEIREAVDFCRYYAAQARKLFGSAEELPGPTGEHNSMVMEGRGTVLCISPWNFPLAIFTGQVAAALAAGNTVIAKPSSLTPLVAARAIELFHQAGFPKDVVQLLPVPADVIASSLLTHPRLAAVLFTGSTLAANNINQSLAARAGAIIPLIAETGGQNAMIVDSSALPEQVVKDVVTSAFDSAGQRCSALRVLYLQHEIKDHIIGLLKGHMKELKVGHPLNADTDIGPVINDSAQAALNKHIQSYKEKGRLLFQCELPDACHQGSYLAPTLIELEHIHELDTEVFGPILHVIGFSGTEIDSVLQQINSTGFGLTLGVHSRIEQFTQYIARQARVGNVYINRNMIGAVVGVQPFGGHGLSGTGPKTGGPHYLLRLVNEKTCSVNTAAIGGNAALLKDN